MKRVLVGVGIGWRNSCAICDMVRAHSPVRQVFRAPLFLLWRWVLAPPHHCSPSCARCCSSPCLSANPDKLVMVYEHFRASTESNPFNTVAAGDFHDWREQTHGFADMAAWHTTGFDLTGEHAELPEAVHAAGGSWNLFSVLGLQPALGRTFTAEEDQPGANHVVMLTWSLFQRRFSADPSILGKEIRLDGIGLPGWVGVLPRWSPIPEPQVQLWVPYASTFTPQTIAAHDDHGSFGHCPLKPGVSADQPPGR